MNENNRIDAMTSGIQKNEVTSRRLTLVSAVAIGAALSACTVGPDYKRPPAPAPIAYKEVEGWKPAEPKTAASGAAWWAIYDDPVLDGLERQIDVSNENLKAAEAAYRQAQAIVEESRAGYFPTANLGGSALRTNTVVTGQAQYQLSVSGSVSWTPDIWGRIRRTVESNVANAQASAADLASARLSAQASLAIDYFDLRVADELKQVYDETIVAYEKALEITRNQYNAGFAAQTDVITAEAQLLGAQAQAVNVGVQRAQLEHAIAVLIGKAPADFSIPVHKLVRSIPVVPAGMPSTLLERRPDIAASERQMASANAQIGIAISAYYPNITISASQDFASSVLQTLFNAANSVWSVGPQISETVYDAGLREAQVAAARAGYDQTVATYRQTVLTAFQQVEDQLAALRILEDEAKVEDAAVQSAREAVRLTLNQYQAGTVVYTSVVTAQAIALTDEQSVLSILQSRLVASVTLVEDLGGGWSSGQLPTADQVRLEEAPKADAH